MIGRPVLLRKGALGDCVWLGAVSAALPDGADVVVGRQVAPLVARLAGVRRVYLWEEVTAEALAGRALVDLQGGARAARLALRLGRLLRGPSLREGLLRRVKLRTGWGPGRPSLAQSWGRRVGVAPCLPRVVGLPVMARRSLVLIPGAAWGPKRPDFGLLVEVGRAWGGPVVVLGGPGEQALVSALARAVPGASWCAEAGFDAAFDVLAGALVAVGGDSGLLHVAGACGARVVGLFGPTHPQDGFFGWPGRVVQRAGLACRPCALHRVPSCKVGTLACQDLPLAAVLAAVRAEAACAGSC